MSKDEVIKHCNKCQRFGQETTNLTEELSFISSPRPFAQWGVDLVGPMPMGKGGCRFVSVDYFTKWEEAEALATIKTGNIRNFLWKFVIC
jgi:hypothetical protein